MSDDLRERIAALLHSCPTETLNPEACSFCAQTLAQADALLPLVQAEKAAAWQEGHFAGLQDVHESWRSNWEKDERTDNPYRVSPSTPEDEGMAT